MKKALLCALGASLLATGALGQIAKAPGGYVMRVRYAKGQVIRLNSVNAMTGFNSQKGGQTQFSTPITLTVLDVQKGLATVQVKMGAVKLGNSVVNQGQTAVVTLDNMNRLVGGGAGASAVGTSFPQRPIKVGQTWNGTIPVSTQMATGKLTATYRFSGVKAVGGKPVAVVTYVVSGVAAGNGTMTLRLSDGTLNSNQLKLTYNMGQTPISITSNMTRS